MGLKQQVINNYIEDISEKQKVDKDLAFLMYGHSLVMGTGPASFDMEDCVDGGQDKQIDAITIEEKEGRANVYITQATTTDGFGSTKLVQMGSGLRWILEASRSELKRLPNELLRDKIIQFRALQSELGPSNISIHVNFIANSDSSRISDEFMHEKERLDNEYGGDIYESFAINAVGIDELTNLAKFRDRRIRSVDADMKFKYDTNSGSVINYFSQGLKGAVITIPAFEIAELVNKNPEGAVFDMNIRQFLGTRGTVNRDILDTASGDGSYEFWFLNNGITIVCDKFDIVYDPDNPKVKISNLQIVNGCQTASSLAGAAKAGVLKRDVSVIARLYETDDTDLVGKIVLTTNNQNQITSRNLRANDPIQISMDEAFQMRGYCYERKPRQYDSQNDAGKVYTNEEVGQAHLALVLRNPADARSRRYKLWDELNDQVFSGVAIEQYILPSLIVRRVAKWLRKSSHYTAKNVEERTLAKRGLYHIARATSFYLLGNSDSWNDEAKLNELIAGLQDETLAVDEVFEDAFDTVSNVFRQSDYAKDIERGIKANIINKKIDAALYRK